MMHFALRAMDYVLGSYCLMCTLQPAGLSGLCQECEWNLPWQAPGCRNCGELLADAVDDYLCHRCSVAPPAFDRCMAAFSYETPIPAMISRFKDRAGFCEFRSLAFLLGRTFRHFYQDMAESPPQLILPVPLHNNRLRRRGYNQAGMLAVSLARKCGIALCAQGCHRLAGTHSQRGLNAAEREKNMSGIFLANRYTASVAGKHVAIIDDVVTTTATVRAMSIIIRQHGASKIDVWAIARANP